MSDKHMRLFAEVRTLAAGQPFSAERRLTDVGGERGTIETWCVSVFGVHGGALAIAIETTPERALLELRREMGERDPDTLPCAPDEYFEDEAFAGMDPRGEG